MENIFPEIPGYKVTSEIARGGMAIVYLAIDEKLHRQVAIKVLKPHLIRNKQVTERFILEGKILAQINHPNVVSVYVTGTFENYSYLVMEYLAGGTLLEKMTQEITPKEAFHIIKGIANLLSYAHWKGYVHRDIKPHNILFREDGSPVLTDFGIAKHLDSVSELTQQGQMLGTLLYMSPEQVRNPKEVDKRSDLFSLGVLFFRMLTGKMPYKANSPVDYYEQVTKEPIPKLPERWQRCQPLVDCLLAAKPEQRFASAEEFIRAVEHTERILFAPAPPPQELQRAAALPRAWYKRPLGIASFVGGALVLSALVINAPSLVNTLQRHYTISLIRSVEAEIVETQQALNTTLDLTQQSREQLEKVLKEKQQELDQLKQRLQALHAEKAQIEQQSKEARLEYEDAIAVEEKKIQDLENKLAMARNSLQQSEQEWQRRLEQLKAEQIDFESKIKEAQSSIDSKKSTFDDRIEEEQKNRQALVQRLQTIRNRIQQSAAPHSEQIGQLQEEQEQLNQQIADMEKQEQQMQQQHLAEIADQHELQRTLEQQLAALQAEAAGASDRRLQERAQQQENLAQIQEQISEVRKQQQEVQVQHQKEVAERNSRIGQLEEELNGLQVELAASKQQRDDDLTSLESRKKNLEHRIENLTDWLAEAKQRFQGKAEDWQEIEQEVVGLLEQAVERIANNYLTTPKGNNAYEICQRIETMSLLKAEKCFDLVADGYYRLAMERWNSNKIDAAKKFVSLGLEVSPDHKLLQDFDTSFNLLEQADDLVDEGRLLLPEDNNAFDRFLAVLQLQPENDLARAGLQKIFDRYYKLSLEIPFRIRIDWQRRLLSAIERGLQKLPEHKDLTTWHQQIKTSLAALDKECIELRKQADGYHRDALASLPRDPHKALELFEESLTLIPNDSGSTAVLDTIKRRTDAKFVDKLIQEALRDQKAPFPRIFPAWDDYQLALLLDPSNEQVKNEIRKIADYALIRYPERLGHQMLADDIYRRLLAMGVPYQHLEIQLDDLRQNYGQRRFRNNIQAQYRLEWLTNLIAAEGKVKELDGFCR